jgi:hypothetical protein
MRHVSALLAGALCVLPCVLTTAQQPARDVPAQVMTGTSVISGTVVTGERSLQPARKARVTLNSVDRRVQGRTTTTDDAGRFSFQELPPGRFNLTAIKPGYLTANYGAKRPERAGTPIALGNGQHIANVVMTIARGGVITGAVRDSRGQPVQGAGVRVLRYSYSSTTGEKTLGQPSVGGSGTTDDRGVYRAWDLPPGDYVVMVTPSAGRVSNVPGLEDMRRLTQEETQRARRLVDPGRSGGPVSIPVGAVPALSKEPVGSRTNYAPVFFPGTTDLSAATTLTLATAEERAGVDVQLQLIPTARIDGTIDLPDGVTLRSLSITLTPAGSQAQTLGSVGRPATAVLAPGTTRTFSFGGVTPGPYTVLAKTAAAGGRGGGTPGAPDATAPVWWGVTDVAVDGRDVSVSMDLHPGLTVTGHVAFEGATPPPGSSAMRFFLVPPGSAGNVSAGPSGGVVDADGRFTFTGVTPGTYRLMRIGSLTGSWSLMSALADGRDVLDAPLEIKPTDSVKDLVVTFTDRPTQLTGVLQDTTGRPASDYFIVVFPSDKSYWTPGSRRVIETRPGNDGRYAVTGLPAGEYRVAALTDVEAGEWNDPRFLEALVNASIKITLVEGETTPLDLRLAGG